MKSQASDQDRDLAAEYVLGTLDGAERETARQRLRADPAFAGLVRNWERRLAPLHELAVPIAPPPALLRAILADLPQPLRPSRAPEPKPAPTAAPERAPPPPAPRAPPRRPVPVRQVGPRPQAVKVMSAAAGHAVAALPAPVPLDRTEALRAMSEAIAGEWESLLAGIDQLEADIRAAASAAPAPPRSEAASAAAAPGGPAADAAASGDAAKEEAQRDGAEGDGAPPAEAPLRTVRSGLLGRIVARWGRPASAPSSGAALPEPPVTAPALDAGGAAPVPDGPIVLLQTAKDLPPPAVADAAAPPVSGPDHPGDGAPAASADRTPPFAGAAPSAGIAGAREGSAPPDRAPQQDDAVGADLLRNGCDGASAPDLSGGGLTLADLPAAEPAAPGPALRETVLAQSAPPEPAAADPERSAPAGPGDAACEPVDAAAVPSGAEAVPHASAAGAAPGTAALPAAEASAAPRRASQDPGLWRAAAAVLAIVAVGLASLVAYRQWVWPRDGNYVAVLQPQASPAVAVRIDPQTGVLFVRAFTPPPPAGMAYHAWLRPVEGQALPLGAFSSGLMVRAPGLGAVGRGGLRTATVAVTLEPAGGEAPRAPRGGVLFEGRLVPE